MQTYRAVTIAAAGFFFAVSASAETQSPAQIIKRLGTIEKFLSYCQDANHYEDCRGVIMTFVSSRVVGNAIEEKDIKCYGTIDNTVANTHRDRETVLKWLSAHPNTYKMTIERGVDVAALDIWPCLK